MNSTAIPLPSQPRTNNLLIMLIMLIRLFNAALEQNAGEIRHDVKDQIVSQTMPGDFASANGGILLVLYSWIIYNEAFFSIAMLTGA